MKLCLGLIAKNEEKMLTLLLSELSNKIDVVAIDYGSTDKTREILDNHCKAVKTLPWPDDFGIAKTNLIKLAEESGYDWIYVIDADETFDTRWIPIMEETIQNNNYDLYYNPRLNYLDKEKLDAGVDSFPDLQARLFKLNVGYHYRNPRHCILYKNSDSKCAWELKYGAVLPMYLIHLKGLRGKEENIKSIYERETVSNIKDVVLIECSTPLNLGINMVK